MPLADILQSRVKARKNDDDNMEDLILDEEESQDEATSEEEDSEEKEFDSGISEAESYAGHDDEQDQSGSDDSNSNTPTSSIGPGILSAISFGTLATAAAALNNPTATPLSAFTAGASAGTSAAAAAAVGTTTAATTNTTATRSPSPFPEAAERLAGHKARRPNARTSKHAPAQLSSKRAVSRKRSVVPVSTPHARDPRFSSLTGVLDESRVKQNYGFLAGYRASEMAQLRARIRVAGEEGSVLKEDLKRGLGAMMEREKGRERGERERAVLREHRKREREAVAEGKRPYFLKRGELKKEALVQRFEALGEKKAARVMERRRKKKAGKERKEMPLGRRME